MSLLAVLPVANCPARFVAGGLEHIQKAFIALPGTLCYESGERWSVQCWNGIFPLVRELHFDNEADWLVDSVPIPSLVSFPRLSLLNLDWSYDSSTALPEIAQPLPSDCQVVLHMMSDYVEVAFHKLKNTGLEEVLTRLELVDFMEQEEGNEGCSISISLLSSFRRLEEIVIHLVEAYETGPYMIKDLVGMGPNFKRAMVDLDGRDEGEWHVQFTSGWKAYTGVDERGQLRLFVERV